MGVRKKERTARNNPLKKASTTRHVKGENFYKDAKKVKKLNMQRNGKAIRNAKGEITKEAQFQSKLASGTMGRVEGNRKWFGKEKKSWCIRISVGDERWKKRSEWNRLDE